MDLAVNIMHVLKFYNFFLPSCIVLYPFLGFEWDLEDRVFGQHFVKLIIPRSLKGHLQNPNPKKALVMAFQGLTGCGKNHVSQIIANNLFKEGTKSNYYHLYVGSSYMHKKQVNEYKVRKFISLLSYMFKWTL